MITFRKTLPLLALMLIVTFTSCAQSQNGDTDTTPSLHAAYEGEFLLGTALNRAQILSGTPNALRDTVRVGPRGFFMERQIFPDVKGLNVGLKHFNVITPENVMKWEEIHPEPGVYDFEASDRLVELAQENGKKIVAHTLVWHNQTPDWVF